MLSWRSTDVHTVIYKCKTYREPEPEPSQSVRLSYFRGAMQSAACPPPLGPARQSLAEGGGGPAENGWTGAGIRAVPRYHHSPRIGKVVGIVPTAASLGPTGVRRMSLKPHRECERSASMWWPRVSLDPNRREYGEKPARTIPTAIQAASSHYSQHKCTMPCEAVHIVE
jgi:hypothetical protein